MTHPGPAPPRPSPPLPTPPDTDKLLCLSNPPLSPALSSCLVPTPTLSCWFLETEGAPTHQIRETSLALEIGAATQVFAQLEK